MAKLVAVLFDFDNTLVNTENLREFRESRDFEAITEEHIAQTKVYRPVKQVLRKLRESGIPIGVVTNSPRTYVERLIAHHELGEFLDAVVTYGDVGPQGKKPSPNGLLMALERLGITERSRVAYVGDEYIDVVAAYRAGVIPVVPSWGSKSSVSTPPAADLSSKALLEMADNIEEMYLFAERCARHKSTDFERELARFLPLDEITDVVTVRQKLRIFCLGRYFSQKSPTTAALHDRHPLSLEIARKDEAGPYVPPSWMPDMLFKIAKSAELYLFEDGQKIDVVTVVPHKPNKPERLEIMLREMEKLAREAGVPILFEPDLLYFDSDATSSLRGLGAYERKFEQNHHLHASDMSLEGLNVLVIDDVITTGATISRALTLLEEMGAKSAFGIGIAKTVSIFEDAKPCPKCERDMMVQKNNSTGERFWSCSGYFVDKACTHTEPVTVILCPRCTRPLRLSRNKRDGTLFYGCTGWNQKPTCNFTKNA